METYIKQIFPDYGTYSNNTHCYHIPYKALPYEYPALAKFYTEFENNYDPIPLLKAMQNNNYVIPTVCIVAYLIFCFGGKAIMENRKPFDLRIPLAYWNLFLSLFSLYGAIRTVPHLLYLIANNSFETTVCENVYATYGGGASGFATGLFILSKIPELIDTVFIVLRKKPLIFLHWYHHVTVLAFCWNSYVTQSSAGLYFVAMNYTVHAVMYFYYYLMALRVVPKWFPSWIITLMQITQMIIGTGIVCASLYFHFYGGKLFAPGACRNAPSNLLVGGIIYASYLYLFVEFALKRFVFKGSKGDKADKAKKSN